MMAVIEMDTLEWQAKQKKPEDTPQVDPGEQGTSRAPNEQVEASEKESATPGAGVGAGDYDSDSYEEVEVTDDEDDPNTTKRPRISQDPEQTPPPTGPVEFNEDDIAWQLAQMEGDYSDQHDDNDYGDHSNGRDADDDEGIPLTADDNLALFRSLLDDSGISPYSVFEKVIEDMSIVEDSRYTALPNTSSRKEAFLQWSKDRIAALQAQKKSQQEEDDNDPNHPASLSKSAAKDPRIQYLRLLHTSATPKLYWPEFKRKYKKSPEMKDLALPDKDREKLYREYISKMKLSDTDRRKELVSFLKAANIPGEVGSVQQLPLTVLRDLRFYLVEERRRDELVSTFLEGGR